MITNVPVRDVREANPVNVTSSPSGRFITSRNEFACELVPVLASAEHGCAVGTKLYTFRWILNQIKIAMGYCSSKINYLGARYPFPLQYNCGAMGCGVEDVGCVMIKFTRSSHKAPWYFHDFPPPPSSLVVNWQSIPHSPHFIVCRRRLTPLLSTLKAI